MESKYLERFKKVKNIDDYVLRGDRLMLEVLPPPEVKSNGGIIIQGSANQVNSSAAEQPTLAVVLKVGAGYSNEDGEVEPLELQPGNVVLISEMGLKYYSSYPGLQDFTPKKLALSRESEVHMYWDSIDAFLAYASKLNA